MEGGVINRTRKQGSLTEPFLDKGEADVPRFPWATLLTALGSQRVSILLPPPLCPFHPSFFRSLTEICQPSRNKSQKKLLPQKPRPEYDKAEIHQGDTRGTLSNPRASDLRRVPTSPKEEDKVPTLQDNGRQRNWVEGASPAENGGRGQILGCRKELGGKAPASATKPPRIYFVQFIALPK